MTKTALVYPKMPGSAAAPLAQCIAFEKYDGTNLHWVWEPELGWYAFGTRRDRFDCDEQGILAFQRAHPGLEEAPDAFLGQLCEPLTSVLKDRNFYAANQIIAFTEFVGSQSFAGKHLAGDPKRLILFDIQIDAQILSPFQFVEHFAELPIARVVYRGKLNGKFADDVREGKYDVAEGVVCKGEGEGGPWMVKIKTHAYLERLKQAFADDWEAYWE